MFKLNSYHLHLVDRFKDETGSAFLIALFVSLILLVMGTSYLALTVTEYSISKSDVHAQRAFEIAEAGIDAARVRLAQTLDFDSYLQGSGFDAIPGNSDDPTPTNFMFEGYTASGWQPVPYKDGQYQITLQNDIRPGDAETNPVVDNNGILYIISKGMVSVGDFMAERTVEVKGILETVWKHVIATPNTPTFTTTGNSYSIIPSSGLNAPKTFDPAFFPEVSLDCYERLAQTPIGFPAPTACGNPPGAPANFNAFGGATIYLSWGAPICIYYNTSPASNPCGSYSYNSSQRTLDFQSVTLRGVIYIEVSGLSPWTVNIKNGVTINGTLVVVNGYINFSGQATIDPPLTGNATCPVQKLPALIALDDDNSYNNPNAPNLPAVPNDCTPGSPPPLIDAGDQNLHLNGVVFTNGAVAANPFDVTGNIVTTGCTDLQGSTDINYDPNIGNCPPPGFSTPRTVVKLPGSWREVLR